MLEWIVHSNPIEISTSIQTEYIHVQKYEKIKKNYSISNLGISQLPKTMYANHLADLVDGNFVIIIFIFSF